MKIKDLILKTSIIFLLISCESTEISHIKKKEDKDHKNKEFDAINSSYKSIRADSSSILNEESFYGHWIIDSLKFESFIGVKDRTQFVSLFYDYFAIINESKNDVLDGTWNLNKKKFCIECEGSQLNGCYNLEIISLKDKKINRFKLFSNSNWIYLSKDPMMIEIIDSYPPESSSRRL